MSGIKKAVIRELSRQMAEVANGSELPAIDRLKQEEEVDKL